MATGTESDYVIFGLKSEAFFPSKYTSKEKSSDFLAAKLYYKMLSYKFMNEEIDDEFDNSYDTLNQKNNISKFGEDEEF